MTWPKVSVTGFVVIDTLIGARPDGSQVQSRGLRRELVGGVLDDRVEGGLPAVAGVALEVLRRR